MSTTEKTYKQMLQETVIKHIGSGPVSPAPKEKETKSPVEDSKGQGTEQAGTKSPNTIPPLAALKKDLAKEGIELTAETKEDFVAEVSNLSDNEKLIVVRKFQEALSKKALKAQANMVTRRKDAREQGMSKDDQRFHTSLTRAIGFGGKSKASKRAAKKVADDIKKGKVHTI